MVQIMITSRDICIVAYDGVVKIQIMTFWITSCDTCKHWTRSRRRRTQPSYFLSPWTCSGRQSHHRHISHSHHLLCHHNLYHCIIEIQFIILVITTKTDVWLHQGLEWNWDHQWQTLTFPRCLNTEAEQDIWTRYLSKMFEHRGRTE